MLFKEACPSLSVIFVVGIISLSHPKLQAAPENLPVTWEEESSYHLKHHSQNTYTLHTEDKELYVSLPSLEDLPQELKLTSSPSLLLGSTGVLSLPFMKRAPKRKVLLSIVGIGAVVGYVWNKFREPSSLDMNVLSSRTAVSSPAPDHDGSRKKLLAQTLGFTAKGLKTPKHLPPPDPKKPLLLPWLPEVPLHQEELVRYYESMQEDPVQIDLRAAKKTPNDLVTTVLGISLSQKILQRISWYIKKSDLGSSDPRIHRNFFNQILQALIENPKLNVADLITNPNTQEPYEGLGVLYESPYTHALLQTLAYLHLLQESHLLTDDDVEKAHAWWFSLSSAERRHFILQNPNSPAGLLLSGTQKLAAYLQDSDDTWFITYRGEDEWSPFSLITSEEFKDSPFLDPRMEAFRNFRGDTKIFHDELGEKYERILTGVEQLLIDSEYQSLFLHTNSELYQIYSSARTLWQPFSHGNMQIKRELPTVSSHFFQTGS